MRSAEVRGRADAPITPETPFNDLADPALRASPILGDMMKTVSELAERPAHITGSGAGFFVLCDESIHAEALATAITERLELPAVAVRSCSNAPLKRT